MPDLVPLEAASKSKIHIALTINGEPAEVAFAPNKTLLEVLREDLALTGTKHGCELGRGGMGVVFLAREVRLDRLVAIKLLPSALATNASVRERFLQEARVAARLSHPNIVAIHAVDEVSGHVFYV
ncbi:MAG TPA: protein kinase, partial [Gemmatimonadaceae bacterium]|nr:protein kinase [Gemmatimonadaceae bacterium]